MKINFASPVSRHFKRCACAARYGAAERSELGRGGGVLITLPLYLVLWSAAEILNDATGYVVFGVSLMLWPCQWAFDLGRSAARPNDDNETRGTKS
ncbi:MAG: hypothetical protein Q8M02_10570 [Candidatus Didemnitutus sp.]|nr:hypothetical protein [Candidatus Didemnitutus sp.]